tara:strand:+ start:590 stop:829 length:240 start_codon:yes stop_codon:yes gene_type:complete
MFRIPEFYQMTMTFDEAKLTFGGDLLAGMERIREAWDHYASGNADDMYEDDDAFYSVWEHEVNAYNTVYTTMKPLFEGC